ncbi:MAG: sugar phosphate isomerase/epimerase [Acidobacteria bacterium]|nr:sugar phosphate isomerase/epimerase [Acidobacteriota bacterium]
MITRREWLASAAAAVKPGKVAVGAHPWVFAAKQPNADPTPVLEQIFREFGAAGLDGVELMHKVLLSEGGVERVRELSRRHRLPVIGTSWSGAMWKREEHGAILAEARLVIPRLEKAGGRTLGISVGDARRKKTPAELDAQAEVLRQVMKMCADHGVVPNLHNHVYEVRDGEHDLNGTLARIPEIKLGPDLGWLYRAKVDPVDFIRRHKSRLVFAHLRNEKAGGTWPETLAEGVIDYPAAGKLLHEIGFSGELVIELAHERDFTPTRGYGESVRLSREYVRRVMRY